MPADLFSTSDLIVEHDPEPRIQDLLVAKRLGLRRPRTIREVIEANRVELESYGPIAVSNGAYRGRPVKEYFLNEGQALVLCMLSRTEKAAEVRHALIDVFMAWRRGNLARKPGAPKLTKRDHSALNRRAWELTYPMYHTNRAALESEALRLIAAGQPFEIHKLTIPDLAPHGTAPNALPSPDESTE